MPINYYFSGVSILTEEQFEQLSSDTPYRLLSCHGSYTRFAHQWFGHLLKCDNPKKNTLLLDSGAFTAWNQNQEVTLDHLTPIYWDFMEKYWQSVKEIYLINLDKIPGSPGRTAGAAEIKECIRISDENYYKLKSLFGDRVLPVFHQGESEDRLKQVCDMAEYICVSPRNDLPEGQRVKWSREVHERLPKGTKTHGLAATGMLMMTTVPWFSVDSATYIFTASTGGVMLCLNGQLVTIGASSKNPARFDREQHLSNVNEVAMETVIKPRLDMLGYTVEQLAEDYRARTACCMREIQFWVDNHYKLDALQPGGLFDL